MTASDDGVALRVKLERANPVAKFRVLDDGDVATCSGVLVSAGPGKQPDRGGAKPTAWR